MGVPPQDVEAAILSQVEMEVTDAVPEGVVPGAAGVDAEEAVVVVAEEVKLQWNYLKAQNILL